MKKSLLELHLSVIIMSGTGIFAKLISLAAGDIIALRALIAALTLFVFIRFTKTRLQIARRADMGWIALIGLLVAVHWVVYFTAIKVSTVAIGLIAIYTFPVMTVLLEPLFFPEPLDRRDLGVALAVFGGVYLAIPGGLEGGKYALGAGLGLISALLYSLRNILYRKYLRNYPPSTIMCYQVAVAAAVLLPFLTPGIDFTIDHRWLYLLVLGMIFTAFSHTLFFDSLRTIKASTAGLISCLEPIYGMIMAAIILAEKPGWKTVAGALIVVAAAVYTSARVNQSAK